MSWKVKFFQTARGTCSVKEFVEEQDEATYAKTLHVITLLENNGPNLQLPFVRKLRDKLYELRISGKVAVRILYCMMQNEYYLLHAFKKKSQKISRLETGRGNPTVSFLKKLAAALNARLEIRFATN